MNRASVVFLALAAVVAVGVTAGLAGWDGEIVNRWSLIGAALIVILVGNKFGGGRSDR